MAVSDAYFTTFWKQYEDGYDWGERSAVYASGYHRGQDIPVGPSYQVPSLTAGTIVAVSQSRQVGGYVIVESGGIFYAYGHVKHDYGVKVGQKVERGTVLGRPAGWEDEKAWQGTSWKGPHVHLTTTKERSGLTNSYGPSLDPRPYIRAALTTAATSSRPALIITPTVQEDDMLLITIKSTKAQIVLTPGRIFHCRTVKDMELVQYGIQKMTGRRPDFLPVDDADLLTYLAQYGVTGILKDTGKGLVIDAAKMPRPGGNFTQALDGAWRAETSAGVKGGK